MSNRESFVARWSRRKRAAEQDLGATEKPEPAAGADSAAGAPQETADAPGKPADVHAPDERAAPPAELPPLDTIVAESDVRAFLAPGVPPELTRAALRRAWSADPKIRDFVGLSENSWDFNDPGAMPGFGPFEMTEELRREILRMLDRASAVKAPAVPAPAAAELREPEPRGPSSPEAQAPMPGPPVDTLPLAAEPDAPAQVKADDVLEASAPEGLEPRERVSKRQHGGALPQ